MQLQGANWVAGYNETDGPHTITVDTNATVLVDMGPNEQMRLALTKVG